LQGGEVADPGTVDAVNAVQEGGVLSAFEGQEASVEFAGEVDPGLIGVAGSCVVEITITVASPGVCGRWGPLVGGTGQKAQLSRAGEGGCPSSRDGVTARNCETTPQVPWLGPAG
jgi:hypothetical protein